MESESCHGKEATPLETSLSPEIQNNWIEAQDSLRRRLVTQDDFTWQLPTDATATTTTGGGEGGLLKYVGGVDISFSKDDPSFACGTLVVLDLQNLDVVCDDYSLVRLHIPYVPGFLAFREAPVLLELLEKMKNSAHPFYPQLLMVDGNGLLHPRGFGLACHLGVLANLPTIGIGKNLHHVDGLTQSRVRQLLEAEGNFSEGLINLIGDSGRVWGAAMRSTQGSFKPIFISVGHRVSLATAVKIAKMTSKYRLPEPVRLIEDPETTSGSINWFSNAMCAQILHYLGYQGAIGCNNFSGLTMALTPKQLSLVVAIFGTLSFIFGILAERNKPPAGEPMEGKGVIICTYPSDPSVPLGYISVVFLVASTAVGYYSLFYPYKGKSVPQSAFFSSGTFTIFFNIALGTSGFAAALLLYTTISEHLLLSHNIHPDLKTECSTAKTGLLGGGAFASLDSALFWLMVLMVGCNVREDYFDEAEEGDRSETITIG